MCFDRALGNIQVASDFRVVAPLQQQVHDLPLAGSHLVKLLVHELHLSDHARPEPKNPARPARMRTWVCGLGRLHARSQSLPAALTKYEIP